MQECSFYYDKFNFPVLYKPIKLDNILPEILSKNNMNQLRAAETEKYAHVTYFFNGGEESLFEGEDRILIPSPKVATYDLQPEMNARDVTDSVLDAIHNEKYDAIIMNYANPDMVGHTGNLDAAVEAVATVDVCLGEVLDAIQQVDGIAIVTADHGNAEEMLHKETGEPHTVHTTNPVPLVLVDPGFRGTLRDGGALCDVAPTLLGLVGLPQPPEMTGEDLRI